ncbi:MAG TPA: hypothetical protein VJT13_00390 [Xanthobacteraceae bacterium]|nr:hypothetical protein [Xanthobacteraceae bacterium]
MNGTLRFAALAIAGACAIVWFFVARASVADALPLAKGLRLGLWTTLVFLLAVLPALVLAVCSVALRTAVGLAALATAIYAAIVILYVPMPAGHAVLAPATLYAMWLLALIAFWIFGDHAQTVPFRQGELRLATLYVAGVGTVLWLSSFAPIIQYAGRGDGFEVIPAMLATVLYVPFVIPQFVLGLIGREPRHPELRWGVLWVALVTTAIFGVPQMWA